MTTYTVQRSTRVDAPAAEVWSRLVDFRRWTAWSPFERLDPGMTRTYSGQEAGVGAVYEWAGNLKAGSGRMEVVEAVPQRRLVVDQRNLTPFRTRCTVTFSLEESGGATTVTWSTTVDVTLLTRVMGVFTSMERVVGPVFEEGLAALRADVAA